MTQILKRVLIPLAVSYGPWRKIAFTILQQEKEPNTYRLELFDATGCITARPENAIPLTKEEVIEMHKALSSFLNREDSKEVAKEIDTGDDLLI